MSKVAQKNFKLACRAAGFKMTHLNQTIEMMMNIETFEEQSIDKLFESMPDAGHESFGTEVRNRIGQHLEFLSEIVADTAAEFRHLAGRVRTIEQPVAGPADETQVAPDLCDPG